MGSFMRLLWDPTRKLDPKTMEDLVLLEQAGVRCVGSERDEELVDQVTAMLQKTRKYRVSRLGGMSPARENEALAASGRYAGGGCGTMMMAPDTDVVGLGAGWKAQ